MKSRKLSDSVRNGRKRPHCAIHPLIKGVLEAQPSGASLVGFNIESACSYGRTQSYNAPVE